MELETCYILCRSYFPNCEFLIGHGLNDGDLFVILDGNPIIRIKMATIAYRDLLLDKMKEMAFTIGDELQLNDILREAKHKLES